MKKVISKKNFLGNTRTVYTHSEAQIQRGASRGFRVLVRNKLGIQKWTGYYATVDEALAATWLTDPRGN